VRVAHVDAEPGPGNLEFLGAHERFAAVKRPAPEVDLESVGGPLHVANTGAGTDRQRLTALQLDEPLLQQVPDIDADAVATHLRDRPVGVVVVHEPLR
jgi:hypothetical protein